MSIMVSSSMSRWAGGKVNEICFDSVTPICFRCSALRAYFVARLSNQRRVKTSAILLKLAATKGSSRSKFLKMVAYNR